MRSAVLVCSLAFVAIVPTFAAEKLQDPWIGTWKLDRARSHFPHRTFTFSRLPNGLMHYSDGTLGSYDFAVDGKPYKSDWDQTFVWTAAGPNAWDVVVTYPSGKEASRDHHVLSADGKTLTTTMTGTNSDGSPFHHEGTATRVGGTQGLEGKWRSDQPSQGDYPNLFTVSRPSAGVVRWDWPEDKGFVEGRPDGTDQPLHGPIFAPGSTMSFRYLSGDRISYAAKVSGRPDGPPGIMTLAPDGRSFTDTPLHPGKESETPLAVYVRQGADSPKAP